MTETDIYNAYQKAQRGEGYLLIGVKGERRNGKQVITAYPPHFRPEMHEQQGGAQWQKLH